MTTDNPTLLDRLEGDHRRILQELLTHKLATIQGWEPRIAAGEDWALYQTLHELGLIADELRRLGPKSDDVPF